MTIEEIKKFLTENSGDESVKAFMVELVSPERRQEIVNEFLSSDEGKRRVQSEADKVSNKAIETWKSNNLDKLVQERYAALHPDETPDQKRLRELEDALNNEKKERLREKLLTVAMKKAAEHKLPADIDYTAIIGEDEQSTEERLTGFAETITKWRDTQIEAAINERIGNSAKPRVAGGEPKSITEQEFIKLPAKEKAVFMETGGTIT